MNSYRYEVCMLYDTEAATTCLPPDPLLQYTQAHLMPPRLHVFAAAGSTLMSHTCTAASRLPLISRPPAPPGADAGISRRAHTSSRCPFST